MCVYLEPKCPLFWLKRALFWGVDLQKQRSFGFQVYIHVFTTACTIYQFFLSLWVVYDRNMFACNHQITKRNSLAFSSKTINKNLPNSTTFDVSHSEKPASQPFSDPVSYAIHGFRSMVSRDASWWLLFPLKALTSTPSPYSWTQMPKEPKHPKPPSDAEHKDEVHRLDRVDKVWQEQIKLHIQVLDLHVSKLMMI